jgi:hypothetical protein
MADIITHQEDTRAVVAPGPAPGRKHTLLGSIAALAMALTMFISGFGTARADTAQWSVRHVYMNLGSPGQSQQSQYYGLIRSLRDAAGHAWRNNVQMTQLDDIHSLIRLDLTLAGRTVQLWFTGNNLYLRGFTDPQGNTYSFNDYDLQGAMRPASAFSSGGDLLPQAARGRQYFVLPYGSDYNAMTQAAGRGRDAMPISWLALNQSFLSLANVPGTTNNQSLARALMFMIQYTSESARFYDVYQVMYNVMGNVPGLGDAGLGQPARYDGLPAAGQEYENNWSQISQYAINLTNGRNPGPLYVGPSAGTLYNFNDVQNHLAEGIGMPSRVSTTGNYRHTEL